MCWCLSKDGQQNFRMLRGESSAASSTDGGRGPVPGMADSWLEVDESFSERLVTVDDSGE